MHDRAKPAGLTLRGGVWHIDKTVREGGEKRQLRESTGERTLEKAQAVLERRINEVRRELTLGVPTCERTFSEAAVMYVLGIEARGKDSSRAELDLKMVDEAIGHLPLSHVHQLALSQWIEEQRGVRASGTVERALRTVTAVLNYAARVLRDGNAPWLGQAVPKFVAPDWGQRKPFRLSWEDQDRLTDALPYHLVPAVLFAVSTGARQAEVTTLRWDQHRPVEGLPPWACWWIPPDVRKANARRSTSQQEGRFLVANAMARSVIAAQSRAGDWVFPSPKTGEAMFRANNHGWRTACRAAGLELRFHDLRHTFGERLATAGVPFDARKTILGHSHSDITAHYSTPGLSRLLSEVERVVRPVQAGVILRVANG